MKVLHKEPQKSETVLSNHEDFCCNTTMRKIGMKTVLSTGDVSTTEGERERT